MTYDITSARVSATAVTLPTVRNNGASATDKVERQDSVPVGGQTLPPDAKQLAANGDKLFWTANGPSGMDFKGGTGRFENATGGVTWVISVTGYDVVGNTMTLYCTYTAEGTITY